MPPTDQVRAEIERFRKEHGIEDDLPMGAWDQMPDEERKAIFDKVETALQEAIPDDALLNVAIAFATPSGVHLRTCAAPHALKEIGMACVQSARRSMLHSVLETFREELGVPEGTDLEEAVPQYMPGPPGEAFLSLIRKLKGDEPGDPFSFFEGMQEAVEKALKDDPSLLPSEN